MHSGLRVAVVASHPVQYHAPWFRELAARCDVHVFFAHRQSAQDQALAGYGVPFEWDVDILGGYEHGFLANCASYPSVYAFGGCDTPEIGERLAEGRYDACVVCGWHLRSYWQAVWGCRRLGIPVFVRGDSRLGATGAWRRRTVKRLAYPWMLRAFDGFLSPGRRHREYLRHYHVPDARIHDVPHFVDVTRFRRGADATDRAATRRGFGAGEGERVVLFVGRLVEFKRPLDVIEAVATFGEGARGTVAVFAGAGPLAETLRERARALRVRVALPGFQNQSALPGIYAAADAFVLPSDPSESWGLVVNEAIASGTPVVVSDAAGCQPDLVDEGATGFSYPCGDVMRLAAAVERAFSLADSARCRAALEAKAASFTAARAAQCTLDALRATRARRD